MGLINVREDEDEQNVEKIVITVCELLQNMLKDPTMNIIDAEYFKERKKECMLDIRKEPLKGTMK